MNTQMRGLATIVFSAASVASVLALWRRARGDRGTDFSVTMPGFHSPLWEATDCGFEKSQKEGPCGYTKGLAIDHDYIAIGMHAQIGPHVRGAHGGHDDGFEPLNENFFLDLISMG